MVLEKRGLGTMYALRRKLSRLKFQLATVISPVLNTKMRYRESFGKKLNLEQPQTFHEKLLWLKLNCYMDNPTVIQCADKYLVRDYICSCGCEEILNDLIGVWDNAHEIPWEELPDKFALKWNFGSGMNIICTDKNSLDKESVIKQMEKWGKNKYWLNHSEMHYKYIPRKIVCEKFLEPNGESVIPDYKVYCFHGEPKAIFVMHDRGKDTIKTEFFDVEWNRLNNTELFVSPEDETPKPACLEKLLDISKKLSQPFPFVRCDFYVVDDKIYFGEMTFTPAGGIHTAETTVHGQKMEDFIHI